MVGLQIQEAGDDLKVVLHSVMDFLEENLLFPQGGAQLFLAPNKRIFRCFQLGYIPGDGEQSWFFTYMKDGHGQQYCFKRSVLVPDSSLEIFKAAFFD